MKVSDEDDFNDDDLVDKVFINMLLSVNPSYTRHIYTGTHGRGSITLEFSVICATNFYGPSCTTYCVNTNNNAGHYTCNSDGTKTCLSGWSNPSGNCLRREIACIQCGSHM